MVGVHRVTNFSARQSGTLWGARAYFDPLINMPRPLINAVIGERISATLCYSRHICIDVTLSDIATDICAYVARNCCHKKLQVRLDLKWLS